MIVTRLRGGLGNQMFQYAAARQLALKHKTELGLDVAYYSDQGSSGVVDKRRYGLQHFAIHGRDVVFSRSRRRAMKRLPHWCKHLFGMDPAQLIRQKRFEYEPFFETLPNGVYLDGWWTSERFFKDSAEIIRTELTPIGSLDATNQVEEIRRSSETVSVHIRRGDYLTLPDHHPTVTLKYLESAMTYFSDRYRFLVFSDKPDWCQAHLSGSNIEFMTDNDEFDDLLLMSACKHHIIANSSFSWWAAWLDPNPDKIVIAPDPWFGPAYAHFETRDIIPPEWRIMEC